MSDLVLSARDVAVRFGGLVAVDGARVDARRGRVLALIGPNGAGKTTFFNALTGHQAVDSGRIEYLGVDVTHVGADARARMGMARSFQLGGVVGRLTALENVVLGLDHRARAGNGSVKRNELRGLAMEYLDRFNLAQVADQVASGLPAGIKREIEVVRALASRATLILLDEPGAGLTDAERQRLVATVRSIAEAGTSFIITDHSTDLVFSVSDEVAVMNFGRIVAYGEPEAIRRDPRVMEAYLGSAAPGREKVRV